MKALRLGTAVVFALSASSPILAGQAEKEIVHGYVEKVVNGREFDRIDEFVATDLKQHNPNLPNGLEPLKGFWEQFLSELPEARFESVRMISEGEFVVDHSVFYPVEGALGVAVVDIYRVVDGKIVQHWDIFKPIEEPFASGNHPVYPD
ncbi:MAG: nuclear transport factor 2 family protein [Pseudomonadota bacterium]